MKKNEKKHIEISPEKQVLFHNHVDECIGTGRMGLALQKEYQEQLKFVQDKIGFRHIRGHGLLCDDMAIYQESFEGGKRIVEYNFTYLDMVMDHYRKLHLKPFLELGFMPDSLASGRQTVFYWKGNVTPPKSYEDWKKLVIAILKHLMERYGREEVVTWPIEVWNEPNLSCFWKDADMAEYFKLFQETYSAIKELNESFKVGGPAICGVDDENWIHSFLTFCREQHLKPDYITRHHYTISEPEQVGHYGYAQLSPSEEGFANLHTTREIVDSFPEFKGLAIHITEFNTAYIPNCPLHDTNRNAAYIAEQLSRLGDDNETYSYWTFGDIFEEKGVPFTPFHGGFGLVANGCIPKPTFWSFVFFKRLKEKDGHCVFRDKNAVVVRLYDGSYRGVLFHATENKNTGGGCVELVLQWEAEGEEYCLFTECVDEETCNPLKIWHDMGEPASLSEKQLQILRDGARPFLCTQKQYSEEGKLETKFLLKENAVIYFELEKVKTISDRGYFYERV